MRLRRITIRRKKKNQTLDKEISQPGDRLRQERIMAHHPITPLEIESIKIFIDSIFKGGDVEFLISPFEESRNVHKLLSQTELARANSYTNSKRQSEYIGGRYVAKTLLTKKLPPTVSMNLIVLDNDPKGSPFFRYENEAIDQLSLAKWHLSLTHKAQAIVAVITSSETSQGIGIDLEHRSSQRNIEGAKHRMVELIGNAEECALVNNEFAKHNVALQGSTNADPFLALFSIKEASYKALRGDAITLKKIELVSFAYSPTPNLDIPSFKSKLQFGSHTLEAITLELNSFLLSIAWW